LDEATSSLDSQSEMMVQQALDELMEGRTTLLVAHRFSAVRRAKLIYVMDNGVVREVGTHEELVGQRGIYNGLFERQTTGLRGNVV
jgi:ABC-type multidrug transport system fused ATPase/permease subunit